MQAILHILARHGRLCLVAGLLGGLLLPGLAATLRPWLPELVAALLFLTALRIGPREALGRLADGRRTLSMVLVLQLALPLAALAAFVPLGLAQAPFALAMILMLAAPSITGAPNFAIMTGQDPAPAMRILVLGTALFPLTVLPIFWALPHLGGAEGLAAAGRLVTVILLSVGAGLLLRGKLGSRIGPEEMRAIDGITALALGVIVVGLMSAIGPLLREDPMRLLAWIAGVFCLNFALQIIAFMTFRGQGRAAVSIAAGNRNIALFLIALPDRIAEPLLIFIGCYQIPMYLTPLLLRPLHARA